MFNEKLLAMLTDPDEKIRMKGLLAANTMTTAYEIPALAFHLAQMLFDESIAVREMASSLLSTLGEQSAVAGGLAWADRLMTYHDINISASELVKRLGVKPEYLDTNYGFRATHPHHAAMTIIKQQTLWGNPSAIVHFALMFTALVLAGKTWEIKTNGK